MSSHRTLEHAGPQRTGYLLPRFRSCHLLVGVAVSVSTLSVPFLGIAASPVATSETRVVRNGRTGLWEGNASKHLHLLTDLSIGVDDDGEDYVFGRIFDVTADSRGRILILDNGFSRVQVYDSTGAFIQSIGRKGEGPGEFAFPTAIDVDDLDNLYVASRGRISVFNRDGRFVEEFRHRNPDSNVRSLRIDLGVGIYLSCLDILEQKVLHKYDSNYEFVRSFCDSYAAGEDVDLRIEQTYGGGAIDLGPDGKIFYTQMTPYEIRTFSPNGEPLLVVHRENDFVEPAPTHVPPDGRMNLGVRSGSSAIVTTRDGGFLNVVRVWDESTKSTDVIIDLFDRDGRLLLTLKEHRNMSIKRGDDRGRLYAVDTNEYPKVVRYRVEM